MPSYIVKPPWSVPQMRRDHRFARNIAFATLLNDPFEPIDLVTGKRGTLTSGMNPRAFGPHGRAITFPGTSTDRVSYTGLAAPIVGSGRCTIAVLANPLSEARTNCLISQRNVVNSRQISLYVNTSSGFSTSAGRAWLYQVDSSAIVNNAAGIASAVTGNWSWYIVTTAGGTANSNTVYYVDGALVGSTANTPAGGLAGLGSENFCLGAPTNYTGGGYTHNKDMAAAFVWNEREFTAEEVRDFVRDPWVWLREAPIEVWPTSSGSTVSGALSSSGSGLASFAGASLALSALSSAATSAAAWVNGSSATSALNSAGASVAAFSGAVLASGQLLSPGSALAAWSGAALSSSVFSSNAAALANFVSTSGGISSAAFSSASTSVLSAVGAALSASAVASPASSVATFSGAAIASSALSSAGTSTFTALSFAAGSGSFTVLGSATGAFVGRSTASASFSATGASSAVFTSPFTGAGSMLDGHRMIYVSAASRMIYVDGASRLVWSQ